VLGNDKEILYAQLDLAPPTQPLTSFRSAGASADAVDSDAPKSPRLRPVPIDVDDADGSATAAAAAAATTYAHIDFKKSDALKNH